jgi:SAM-dependent methyltransferase
MSGAMPETHQAAAFYATARGAVAAQLVRARLADIWPSEALRGQALLALGYGAPYLRLWRESAYRCVAVSPAQSGLCRWPPGAPNRTCAAEEDSLPFPDLSFDRILLVHGLEAAENARRMLREVWRVLKDDGRLLVVAPNRRGLWAHLETTPFGHGQPYSAGQIGRLLAAALFRVERRDTALYMPPVHSRLLLRASALIERGGRRVAPTLAGVTITEAVKDVYAAMPVAGAVMRRRLVLADAA